MAIRIPIFSFVILAAALVFAQAPAPAPRPSNPQDVRITHGPTVEFAGFDRAIIAWSTNVSSGTVVRYGTDRNNLAQEAKAPWGSLTHRVTLKKLQPGTEYFFRVISGEGAGTGTQVQSDVQHFETKAAPPKPAQ